MWSIVLAFRNSIPSKLFTIYESMDKPQSHFVSLL